MPFRSLGTLGVGALAGVCVLPAWGQKPHTPDTAQRQETISVRELAIPLPAREFYARSRHELIDEKKPESAVTHLRKAIKQYPGYYEAYYLLGVALLELKRTQEAEAALQRSVSLSAGRFAPPLLALATLYCDQRRFAEAEPLAAHALDLDDSLWYARYELARARFSLGRAAEALAPARTVVSEQPDYPRGRLLLTLVLAQLRKYDEAAAHLDAYLQLLPDAPDRARMLQLRAELIRAADALQTVAATSP